MEENPYATPGASVPEIQNPSVGKEISDTFQMMFALVRSHAVVLLAPVVVYMALMGGGFYLAFYLYQENLAAFLADISKPPLPGDDAGIPPQMEQLITVFGAVILALGLAQAFFSLFITRTAGDLMRTGAAGDAAERVFAVLRKLPAYIFYKTITLPLVYVGLFLCYAPGLVLMLYLSMLGPVMVIGGRGLSALGASFAAISGRFWATALVYLVMYFVLSNITSVFVMIGFFFAIPTDMGDAPPDIGVIFASMGFLFVPMIFINLLLVFAADLAGAVMYVRYARARGEDPFGGQGHGDRSEGLAPGFASDGPRARVIDPMKTDPDKPDREQPGRFRDRNPYDDRW